MTVIAWDGTTLAADKRACAEGYIYSVTKVYRIANCLVGFSGNAAHIGRYRAWIVGGCDPTTYPPQVEHEHSRMLVIRRDRTIERYETTGWPMIIEERQHAMGSGRDFAAAAMHLGCDARRAVEVASALSEWCGNGVDTLTFDGSA